MPSAPWEGKSAIICGASAGLGKAIAAALVAQRISQLILVGRNAERLQECASELQRLAERDVDLQTLGLDLADADAVALGAKQLREAGIEFDLIVQAVGQSDRGLVAELEAEHLDALLQANVHTSLNAVRFLTPLLRKRRGTLVLVGSLASHFAPRFLGGYAIAKHALAALAQQSRLEFAEQGIHVMLASPGPIARSDAGQRYADRTESLPEAASKPGGGARLAGLNADELARDILQAAYRRHPLLIRPWKARLLLGIQGILPRLAERLLRKNSA